MKTKTEILSEFAVFSVPSPGIGSWLTEQTHPDIFERLGNLDADPLPAVQLNQLLFLASAAITLEGEHEIAGFALRESFRPKLKQSPNSFA